MDDASAGSAGCLLILCLMTCGNASPRCFRSGRCGGTGIRGGCRWMTVLPCRQLLRHRGEDLLLQLPVLHLRQPKQPGQRPPQGRQRHRDPDRPPRLPEHQPTAHDLRHTRSRTAPGVDGWDIRARTRSTGQNTPGSFSDINSDGRDNGRGSEASCSSAASSWSKGETAVSDVTVVRRMAGSWPASDEADTAHHPNHPRHPRALSSPPPRHQPAAPRPTPVRRLANRPLTSTFSTPDQPWESRKES